jgi:hypothetical protein
MTYKEYNQALKRRASQEMRLAKIPSIRHKALSQGIRHKA